MATYTIVSSTKNPLGPFEINANTVINPAEGDVYIIDPTADANITFQSGGGSPVGFEIQFLESNAETINIKVEDDLTPTVTIADDVAVSDINLDVKATDAVNVHAGDNVSFGRFEGSADGPNTLVIGDDFSTDKNWKLGGAEDSFAVGNNATFHDFDAGGGNDTLEFGDGLTIHDLDAGASDDNLTFGDDLDAHDIKGSDGNDTFKIGENAQISKVDGGSGDDTVYTQSEGVNQQNVESSHSVCYAPGTLIDTPSGPQPVEALRPGDLVTTLDGGPSRVRWVRSDHHPLDGVATDRRPVLIKAGALGGGRPARDLIVSPQHRILAGEGGQLEEVFDEACLVPAKALTVRPGIRSMMGKRDITWVHFALNRHEVVNANGCLSESLFLGPMVVLHLPEPQRRELVDIFGPCPADGSAMNGPAARPFLTVGQARRQLDRRRHDVKARKHVRHGRPSRAPDQHGEHAGGLP